MRFNPLEHPIVFQGPRYYSRRSGWIEHFPLAFLLIDLARPRLLVEMGTHYGDSYCAFCQAINFIKPGTHCFAVDHWKADSPTGVDGAEALVELRRYHDPVYGSFSTLLQMDFSSAVSRFEPGSIDLLHIDGHQSYDAIRRDFELWRSRTSDRGVVLLHDTAVKNDPSLGAWQLWEELQRQYPGFNFPNGNGLGILLIGSQPPLPLTQFIQDSNQNPQSMRDFFACLGQRMLFFQSALNQGISLLDIWDLLGRWRQMTGEEPLQAVPLMNVMTNPPAMTQAVGEEMMRILEEQAALRQLQPADAG